MTTKEITITATSGGYGGNKTTKISVDSAEIGFGSYQTGINVAVFDETNGKVLFSTSFNTPYGNSDRFADFINSLPAGRIVALTVKDSIGSLTDKAKEACKSIGSAQIDLVQPGYVKLSQVSYPTRLVFRTVRETFTSHGSSPKRPFSWVHP
ncbi:MAG: interleukin-like EMT inducer domain-containing protein [Microcoleaceae cyanobacterium]